MKKHTFLPLFNFFVSCYLEESTAFTVNMILKVAYFSVCTSHRTIQVFPEFVTSGMALLA